jgi:transketolase
VSIHRTKAGTYEAHGRPPGSRAVKSKRFKLKKDAVVFMAKVESSKREGTYTDLTRGKQTLEEWWREYFAHSLALRPSTRENYRRTAELHILPYLGKRRLGTITESEVKSWLAKLQKNGVGTATINAAHRLLRTVLNVALKERIIGRNPAVGVRAPKPQARRDAVSQAGRDPSYRGGCAGAIPSPDTPARLWGTSHR